jgi:uncharacterized membrane protein
MNLFLAHAHGASPFDLKAALLARHAQHPVIVHFPIALFILSVIFELLAAWRKNPVLASAAYYNLLGAALSVPLAVGTGLAAWQWQLEGAKLKGNLQLHLVFGLTSAAVILLLCSMRSWLRIKNIPPGITYIALTLCGMIAITLTGHLGGFVSGVEAP